MGRGAVPEVMSSASSTEGLPHRIPLAAQDLHHRLDSPLTLHPDSAPGPQPPLPMLRPSPARGASSTPARRPQNNRRRAHQGCCTPGSSPHHPELTMLQVDWFYLLRLVS